MDVAQESGVATRTRCFADERLLFPTIMGGGCAVFDADGDGDLDIYIVNGNEVLPSTAGGTDVSNRFFRQESPWRFVDATEESGLGDRGYGMGATVGDIDNDGDIDVFVTNYGPDRLYRNRGDGTFEDATAASGLGVPGWSVSAAFADIDRDGLLDLHVVQYLEYDPSVRCSDNAGRPEYCGPLSAPAARDRLFRNEGGGRFSDISESSGIASVAMAGLGVVADDFDGDGWVDLYVANDAYANNLWVNQRDGTFVDDAVLLGAAYNLNSQAEAGMGVVAADLDGDTWIDLFVTHLMMESNTYYRNLGGQAFEDSTGKSGLGASSMNFTGFGVAAADLELDGDLDLLVGNGRVRRGERHENASVPSPLEDYAEPDLIYRNDGDGRFRVSAEIAPAFSGAIEVTRGVIAADLDADGDLDAVITRLEGPVQLLRNDAERVGSWLRVRAIDPALGRDAIGARVSVPDGDRTRVRTVTHAQGYATAGPAEVHFGVVGSPTSLRVRWPGGEAEEFDLPGLDRALVVRRGEGRSVP